MAGLRRVLSVAGTRGAAAVLQGLILLSVAQHIGAEPFGIFVAVVAVGSVIGVVTSLGTSSLALRLRAIDNGKNVAASISIIRFPSTVVTLIFCYFVGISLISEVHTGIVLAAMAYVAAEAVSESTESVLFGLQRIVRAQASLVARRLIMFGLIAAFILLDMPIEFSVMLAGAAITILSPLWLIGVIGRPFNPLPIIRSSLQFFYSSAVGRLEALDVVIATLIVGGQGAGMYGASSRLTSPLNIMATSALSIYTPQMSAADSQSSRMLAFDSARKSMKFVAIILMALSPAIGFSVEWLLGDDYEGIWGVAMVVTMACSAGALSQSYISYFYSVDAASLVTKMRLLVVPLALVLMAILGLIFGAIGVALGSLSMQCGQYIGLRVQYKSYMLSEVPASTVTAEADLEMRHHRVKRS